MKKLLSLILILMLISFGLNLYGLEVVKDTQALTAAWADIGNPVQTGTYGVAHILFTVEINDSTGVQFRYITKLSPTHATNYERCILTTAAALITTKPEIYEIGDNVDGSYHWFLDLDWRTPYTQIQVKVGTVNATAFAAWQASHVYALAEICEPTVSNGYYYVVTTNGTSAAGEPAPWGTTVGGTTADNTVVWTCYQIAANINNLYVDMR